ncbi:MAG: nucleotide exchange factor GrpE [Clostridiales bacterium GWF2_38_85]|nr:MAG: nucleotide exchange factor GrpE [Clostridiales bacterium GWF2_38_85]HBL83588.1 nucleotide exchange factor GrpE [Clostridiales bacterium]
MGKKDKNINENEEIKKGEKVESTDATENTAENSDDIETPDSNKEIDELKKQLDELNDKYLRLIAEYDNYRKRSQKEKSGIYTDAYAEALLLILPIVDNVERAAEFATDDSELSKGINMLQNQCLDFITKTGIKEIKALGEQFNPELHNAIAHSEDDETPANTITQVFVKGYKKDDKVIRYALVKVTN